MLTLHTGAAVQASMYAFALISAGISAASSGPGFSVNPDYACARTTACLSVTNKGAGDAIHATSSQSFGIIGKTRNAFHSGGVAGVFGINLTGSRQSSR
jgi:hypothetical protein